MKLEAVVFSDAGGDNKLQINFVWPNSLLQIKIHGHVSEAKKDMQAHQCVIYATDRVADFSLS